MTIPYGAIYRQKIVPFSVESHNLRVFGPASFKGRFLRRQGREDSGLVSAVLGGVDSVDLEGLFEVAGLREVEGHLHAQPRLGC